MVKSVLVPIDFSGESRRFLDQTLEFLGKENLPYRVVLLNTYKIPQIPNKKLLRVHDELRKKSLENLKNELDRLKAGNSHPQLSFETLSSMGSLENVIVNIVEERKIDSIFLDGDGDLRKNLVHRRVNCRILLPSALESELDSKRSFR